MNKYYGVIDPSESDLEKKNRKLAFQAAAEGFILLKNNNALPLKEKSIALYGMGARKTVKGGLGSGSVEERYSVNIEDGLENAGYEITTKKWLNDYDEEYTRTYEKWHDMVEGKIAGLTNPWEVIPLAHSFVYRFPSGRTITDSDVKESRTETALYVLMRQAGEGNDRKLEPGDYYITDIERENLKIVAAAYRHTILVINVGGTIDLGFLDEIDGIDAVVLFGQGGMEGGNALAEVLSGRLNFSGKLTDTLPLSYDDIPFGKEFSYLNGDLENEYYREGIYVGYRYYDSFGIPVRYPFGFGLSYTEFTITADEITLQDTKLKIKAVVKNIGTAYSGKEVVQVYVSAPQGKLKKEYQSLAGFTKTKSLAPGECQKVSLEFELADTSCYNESMAAWVLENGKYLIRIGNSSQNTKIIAVVELEQTVITQQCKNCCRPNLELGEIDSPILAEEAIPDNVVYLKADSSIFATEIVDYTDPKVIETNQEKEILDSLSTEELIELLRGGNMQEQSDKILTIHGMAGTTATSLVHKGIGNIAFCDGPAGINVVNQICFCEDGTVKITVIPERYNWGILAKTLASNMTSTDGVIIHRYATAWPVEIVLAQTWNTELLTQIGEAVAEEMTLFGVTLWLAPGMNIHRNPLGGRTFEYYSEDPVLSGKMAAALSNGVQKEPGLGVTIKHFCCNNTEDNRDHISSNVNERALREIYLKGFRIAIKESQPKAVMSSYNKLNQVYTANNYELITDILRCEWGFEGVVMTDWNACKEENADPALCPAVGNDLVMPGTEFDRQQVIKAIESGELDLAAVRRCACRVLRIMLEAKTEVIK